MTRWLTRTVLVVVVLAAPLMQAPPASAAFTDVPTSYWDYTAIDYVAQQHTWMQDYGTSTFKPTIDEERRLLARTLVTVYAPNEPVDPTISFSDVPTTDPYYRYINVATKLGWLPGYDDGTWRPTGRPYTRTFDRALILAMGKFSSAISGLQNIHTYDGTKYSVDSYMPYMQLAHWLGLHYNHSDETLDLNPKTYMKRDEVAYSLWKATTLPSWEISDAAAFNDIALPNLDPSTQAGKLGLTKYALKQIGFPYVWGGEWNAKSPSGYCCGSQPIAGMDCSGFTWWVLKKYEGGYNAAQFHPDYAGWTLPQRTSSDMAYATTSPITWSNLKIGDLMFFSGSGGTTWSSVDHVGIWLGNNWMINSASSTDGVVLEPVATGWFRDHFVYGRRMVTSANARAATAPSDPSAGEAGSGPRR